MLDLESRQAVADLADALLAAGPMIDLLPPPVRVATGDGADPLPTANLVARTLGTPDLCADVGEARDDGQLHRVVSDRLALPEIAEVLARIPPDARADVESQVRRSAEADLGRFCTVAEVPVEDGVAVRAYAAGPADAPAVALSSACGMPARLAEPWLRHLAERYRVVAWESRGMFPGVTGYDSFAGATDVAAQVRDGLAVLDALELREVHVAGLCGGAVVAAQLAAAAAGRVHSLSLWHGDFDLGADSPRTDHQRNLLGLLDAAAVSPEQAAGIHRVMCQSMLGTVPADLAPLALYPYVTPELFLRYCRLNGAIMHEDIRPTLDDVHQPVLVVTSRADETAHPEGSIEVARRLEDATLVVNETGDHITLFRGEPHLRAVLDEFLGEAAAA